MYKRQALTLSSTGTSATTANTDGTVNTFTPSTTLQTKNIQSSTLLQPAQPVNLLSTATNLFITEPNVPAVAVLTLSLIHIYDYLLAHEVPEDQIIAETQSTNTEESAARLGAIARENHLNRILAVSDGTHLFRIRALCASLGLDVVTSPRAEVRPLGAWDAAQRLMHEMFSYTLWRLKMH